MSPGDLITYTLTLTNTGSIPASGLTVTDPVPRGTTYVPGSAIAGEYDPRARTLTWNVAELIPGGTVTLTFQAHVTDQAQDPLVNMAEVTAARTATAPAGRATPTGSRTWANPGRAMSTTPGVGW